MWLVCHLVDRPAAFAELRRVLAQEGRLVVVTFDPAHFGKFWLNRYFPSIERIDRARFPDGGQLEVQLATAGFGGVRLLRHSQRRRSVAKRHSSASSNATSRRSISWTRTK